MNLKVEVFWLKRLLDRSNSSIINKGKIKYDHISVSSAFGNLNKIKKYSSKTNGVNDATKNHRKHLVYLIEKALDT